MDYGVIARDAGISVDEVRIRHKRLMVARWKASFRMFAKHRIKIRNKKGLMVPLVLNEAQEIVFREAEKMAKEDGWIRLNVLKARRQGISTMIEGVGYWFSSLWEGQNIYVQAHVEPSSKELFEMVKRAWKNDPFREKTSVDNVKSLKFDRTGSSYVVATAGSKGGGRGGSVSFFHGSEVAYYPNAEDNLAGATQSVDEVKGEWGVIWREPERPLEFEKGIGEIEGWIIPPSCVWAESTSAGNTGIFFAQYQDGMNRTGRYRSVFTPWTIQSEYCASDTEGFELSDDILKYGDGVETTEKDYAILHGLSLGQMKWRREKIDELRSLERFRQEFPINVSEAFSSADIENVLIKPSVILKARKRTAIGVDAPLIVGIDPASGGGDRFAIVGRRGDSVEFFYARNDLDPKEATIWVKSILEETKPARAVIDSGNLGIAILAFLKDASPLMSEIVRGVNFGNTSQAKTINPKKAGAVNRRAEMYGRLRDWLLDGGCVPDDDSFCADLEANRVKHNSNNDWGLLSKKELKKLGIKSPDIGDALACTFAFKEHFDKWTSGGVKHENTNERLSNPDVGVNPVIDSSIPSEVSWMA